jgi:hypothetical protein
MLTPRSPGGFSVTSTPLIRMLHSVARSSPAIIRVVVVLPQPEEPRSVTRVPGMISRLTSSTAVTAPYRLVNYRNDMRPLTGRLSLTLAPLWGTTSACGFGPLFWWPLTLSA